VNGIHEVRGSIPLSSTNQINKLAKTGKTAKRRFIYFLSIFAVCVSFRRNAPKCLETVRNKNAMAQACAPS